ncbi:SH3 domain-containing protein [Brucella pituitosa]|uniref:SH3 domain-containing protein n=1 Tax=Brucella pituitosa TaxID=571256 RepID=A0A643F1P6_9HYPH|nr:SH3 domain-containing protein [Brucella pituitosa]KAB0571080.1 SH3 domain-containing protein [Brucella pituitosa]
MSKAKNWILGAAALFVLVKVFGKDEPQTVPSSPPVASQPVIKSPEPAIQPMGFVQATSPRQTETPPPSSDRHPLVGKTLYATANVNMRQEPSVSAKIITSIGRGKAVKALNYRSGWFSVSYDNRTGWVSEPYLAEKPPSPPAKTVSTSRTVAPPVASRVAPARRLGQPTRSAYVGTCDCPYDRMRNGRLCGRNSAYSKPGGRSPVCYH